MNLKQLSSSKLISQTKELLKKETEVTLQILHYLLEIEVRMICTQECYSSLFNYAVKVLGYSEGPVGRRIAAMRLLRELPEIETSIQEGKLNLTTVSSVHYFFQREKNDHQKVYSKTEKIELLQSVEGATKRKTDQTLADLSPQSALPEKERILSSHATEVRFVMTEELRKKLERIKNLTAHQNPEPSYAELFEKMADRVLKQIDPLKKERNPKNKITDLKSISENLAHRNASSSELNHLDSTPTATPETRVGTTQSTTRSLPAATKDAEWKRDRVCTYTNPHTGQICGADRMLELDHTIAYALGGETTVANLRLRCRAHNVWTAMQTFGTEKMNRFRNL